MSNLTTTDSTSILTKEAQAFSAEIADSMLIKAQATNIGGFTVNQDLQKMVVDYRRKNTYFWQMLEKLPARNPKIQEIRRNTFPNVGFVDRNDLSTTPVNDIASIPADLSDPGQDVKAIAGLLNVTHFGRSMEFAQGSIYGDSVAQDTDDLIVSVYRTLEKYLFTGDASAGGGTQFNGLAYLASPDAENSYALDYTVANPTKIVQKLEEITTRVANHSFWNHRITHIFCSAGGYELIRKETENRNTLFNQVEFTPGVQVPAINSAMGNVPLLTTPYLFDVIGTGSTPVDTITYYLVDDSTLSWRGLAPFGGVDTFEPQIFDVSNIVNGVPLLEKRFVLLYGTPYARNRGKGIYKLVVTAPSGSGFYAAS